MRRKGKLFNYSGNIRRQIIAHTREGKYKYIPGAKIKFFPKGNIYFVNYLGRPSLFIFPGILVVVYCECREYFERIFLDNVHSTVIPDSPTTYIIIQ